MEAAGLTILGDQSCHFSDLRPFLRILCDCKGRPLVEVFLDLAIDTLQDEWRALPESQRKYIPAFRRFSDLVDEYGDASEKIPQLESVIVIVAQFAHGISYYGEDLKRFPNFVNMRMIGLCTGLLPAAAIASACSLDQLLELACVVLRIAFRTATRAAVMRENLEPVDKTQSWTHVVNTPNNTPGKTRTDLGLIVERFNTENGLLGMREAYVSSISDTSVGISGPPSTTRKLFASETLKDWKWAPISVFAPYHAPHLYCDEDIDSILTAELCEALDRYHARVPFHSASTGKPHSTNNTLDLVRLSLREILMEPVRLDKVSEEVLRGGERYSAFTFHSFGVTHITNHLAAQLREAGHEVTILDHASWARDSQSEDRSTKGRTQQDKIAIIGMAGRFPSAADHEALWELLMKGLDVHREVPPDRFDAQAHCDPSGKGKNKSHTPYGCFIDNPGLFDPRFFNMSPREAAQTDPMGRLALVTAYEALEMAGYVPNRTASTNLRRIGTFYGQTSDDWREINAAENVDTYFITGGVRAFAPGRINYFFKFSGPSFSIDTACSSSLAAIQLACTSLWAGDCDTACAGGLNVLTNPDIFAGLSKGQFLSKTGSCKTYDNDADGYCRGDGCGTVILKRYEDAIADKDNILGCILGAATNHSAEAVSITHPHAGAQEFLYKKVLADSGVDAHDISYVEMHGTGTQAGDGIEMTSVSNVFAPRHRQRRADQPLHLGAIKANIGHGEAASGINSLVKVMMMMQKNAIPPNVGIKGVMNKTFPKDLEKRNVNIDTVAVPWPRDGEKKRKVFLNNFSAAGGNTALVLEDGPLRKAPGGVDPRTLQVVTVSARSIASLKRNINRLVDWLDCNLNTTLPSLAYTTTARRLQHNYRVAICVSEMAMVKDALKSQLKDTYSPIAMVPTKVAFTFTGQGSQYTGLGQKLYAQMKTFKEEIDELNYLCGRQGFPSIIPLLDGTDIDSLSPVVVQLGMACVQVALARTWKSWGVKPSAVIGHSLGEYAALHIAGVLSASDMILLVGRRAELLQHSCTRNTHGMLAVKGSLEVIKEQLGENMTETACVNGPEETVLCGKIEQIAATAETLSDAGFKTTRLNVSFAFHSSQVDPILEDFWKVASSVEYRKPQIPLLAPLTGEVIREAGVIDSDYLVRHARETVNFLGALQAGQLEKLIDDKTAWVEIGAHPVCLGMIKSTLGSTACTAASLRRNEDPWKTLSSSIASLYLAGAPFDFNEYHREYNDSHELLILPTYSFDEKNYWLDYHNNWCLTKGEAPAKVEVNNAEPVSHAPSKLSTTSCHRIVYELLEANTGTVLVQSDLSEPKLKAAISGHQVNGTPLCPSSLYADQAMTLADYLYRQLRPNLPTPGLNVCAVEVTKPLIPKYPAPPEGQHLQIEAKADLITNEVQVRFLTVPADGSKVLTEHAKGTVKYESVDSWTEEWKRTEFMVQAQIDFLEQKLATGAAHKVLRGMAYKLFKALVTYADNYRGMEEVILDGKQTEAVSTVHFQTTPADGTFFCSPYWIDSLAHLSGFIVNASEHLDSENSVYISHGWGSIKISRPLSPENRYRSYVRMQPAPGNMSVGDVYILEGCEVIGLVSGLKFQNIPRRALNIMLPPAGAQVRAPAAPATSAPLKRSQPQVRVSAAPNGTSPPVKQASKKTSSPPRVKAGNGARGVAPAAASVTSRVMKIIAEETDVDMSELVDEAAFENLGVDSLMSLTISAKFREELDLEISSTLFIDYPTVGEMKKYFSQHDKNEVVVVDADEEDEDTSDSSDSSGATTSSISSGLSDVSSASTPPEITSQDEPCESEHEDNIAREIVAEEMGVDISEITDKADLSSMGMDSLMSLTIMSRLREATGIDIPSTFLATHVTIEDIENALDMRPKEKPKAIAPQQAAAKQPQLAEVNKKLERVMDLSNYPPATSCLLQGKAQAKKTLWLIPDGSGSATSYVSIPKLSDDLVVYGLNCPFMREPEKWNCGVEGVSALYLQAMKKKQPKGPYIVGGWSAGGVMAYEVAQQLVRNGEKLESLILIDAPCPVALDPLPARLHIFFDRIGLLGTGKEGGTPKWLLPHFASAIKNLKDYEPVPMDPERAPPVHAIWCTDGVCPNPDDPRPPPSEEEDPAPMKWLLNNRHDFGDNGWAQLLPAHKFRFSVMGGNHFTMMKGEHSVTLGELMRKGLGLDPPKNL
ncbi:polyketide synthase PksA [Sporormia fimetaria CBS 119925]|uniref:Polyketide synthase PksA n=1 Tax=Sporormia fimetaria CBS 119925 TaxID=1340428 RepID=A0A6A6VQY7_9PLEO|nr:polyketide synthase PksA [Sporormia fimetaria CBS 119925]